MAGRVQLLCSFFHYIHILAVVIPMSIFHQTTEPATVTAGMNFPTNSFQSRDCCQPQFIFEGGHPALYGHLLNILVSSLHNIQNYLH